MDKADTHKCFVIMKFGSTDEEAKLSNAKYEHLISRAACESGYEQKNVIRADLEGAMGGNLDKNVILNLAQAEIVIADISDANPNVLYELGVRHTLKRKGTVLIKEKDSNIPFDLAKQYIHSYTFDTLTLTDEIKSMSDYIRKRKTNTIDSPVHDWLDFLPSDVTSLASGQEENSALEKERKINSVLSKRVEELEKIIKKTGKKSIAQTLDFSDADTMAFYYGAEIYKRMSTAYSMGNTEEFKKELNSIVEHNEYIDAGDFVRISLLCEQMKLAPHRIALLEFASQKFPSHERLLMEMIDAYNDSPSQNDKDKALQKMEEYFCIERNETTGLPEFTQNSLNSMLYTQEKLTVIFNAYIGREEFKELLSIANSAESILKSDLPIVLRNKARALRRIGDMKGAVKLYRQIISSYPSPGELASSAEVFYTLNENEIAYRLSELSVILDYDNPGRYISLAIDIHNYSFTRTKGETLSLKNSRRIAHKSAIPLLFKAIALNPVRETVVNVIRILLDFEARNEVKMLREAEEYSYSTLYERLLNEEKEEYDFSVMLYIDSNASDEFDVQKALSEILALLPNE